MPEDEDWEPNPFVLTVYDYALQANPEETWDTCCVCGCAGDCSSFDGLDRGLVLLADQTLGRAAWCRKLACSGEKHSSTMIPASVLEIEGD
jgi:hypothetical protein